MLDDDELDRGLDDPRLRVEVIAAAEAVKRHLAALSPHLLVFAHP
jgi:hypothetical protein